jgi:acetoin utilization deacetylase AcuC-like enzyme
MHLLTLSLGSLVVCIYSDVGNYSYGQPHVMRPWRLTITHDLVHSYKLTDMMDVYIAQHAIPFTYKRFHSEEYINALMGTLTDSTTQEELALYGLNVKHKSDDYIAEPINSKLHDYMAKYVGASWTAAANICTGAHDIAINWSGGMHHAHKSKAYGFCYINDCVLAIMRLLFTFDRVLYVDIDAQ